MKIGFELQDVLLKKAKELNFDEVWLSVLNSNERAISFYKKTGFEKIGNHDFQIGMENFRVYCNEKETCKMQRLTIARSKWSLRKLTLLS